VGYIQLESTSIEQVVNVWHQQILLFLVLDDHIDLDKILKAGVKLLVADVRDNKVDRLVAVLGVSYAGDGIGGDVLSGRGHDDRRVEQLVQVRVLRELDLNLVAAVVVVIVEVKRELSIVLGFVFDDRLVWVLDVSVGGRDT
jgi:hypothetical protein